MLLFNLDWLMIYKYMYGINLFNDLVFDWKNYVGFIYYVLLCIFILIWCSSMCFKVFECFKKKNEILDNFNKNFKNIFLYLFLFLKKEIFKKIYF